MNYLAHLYLSDPEPLCRLGNLLGDFVKGRLDHHVFPASLTLGLRQHRAVDRLALDHPAVRRSKSRMDNRFGHAKGILVDIFYDHFLAKNWSQWAHGSLGAFAGRVYALFERYNAWLPDAFRPVAERMAAHDWLTAYRDPGVIKLVLHKTAARLTRPTPLAHGYAALKHSGRAMESDCLYFLRDARRMLNGLQERARA